MSSSRWRRVSAKDPCPICGKGGWCRVTHDGTLAGCMRVEQGCYRSKENRDGTTTYLHRLADGPRPEPALSVATGPEAQRADADTLHAVYSALLQQLKLSKGHHEALVRRGLRKEAIDRGAYRTLPTQGRARLARRLHEVFGDKLLQVPGFVVKEGASGRYFTLRGPTGLIVPCRDRKGCIVALKVRRDDAAKEDARYSYCSSTGHGGPGSGAPVHYPVGMPEKAELARVTEGELKADVIQALTGMPTFSVPGTGSWRTALAAVKALGCKTIRLAFDADAVDKPSVAKALARCAEAIIEAGFALELEQWDLADGKGLDDLLAAGKAPELLVGDAALGAIHDTLAAATSDEEPTPPDELGRLKEVLEGGGAEALFRDKALMQALANLAESDPAAYAAVRASLKNQLSLRDLDKALAPLRRQAAAEQQEDAGPMYFEQDGQICRSAQTRDGPITVPLCNFTARIVLDVEKDDGAERTRLLAIEGTLANGSPLNQVQVPAADFVGMDWLIPSWGTQAVVYAGAGTRDHLRAALQLRSGDVPRRTVYGHVGWRQIDKDWVYLHAGGGIGARGLDADIPVVLPEPLAGFQLPAPPTGAELVAVVRASLGLLRLGPERIMMPLLAMIYRAALGNTDFAVHLAGATGCFKSEAAALAQQHFGASMDARHLPANWSSTGNALEGQAFVGKDTLLCVDDFCPTGSAADVQRYHREADRLFRGQGNRSGRQRLRADASLRPARPPRGLILSTGEDTPRGQSLRARLLVLEVTAGDIGPSAILSALQKDAASGKYAQAMSGYLRWLAPQRDAILARLPVEMAELRSRASAGGQHARTPGIVADLALGLHYLLAFARAVGAITNKEQKDLWERGWLALTDAASTQAAQIASAEPTGQYLRLLAATLVSGRAHVAAADGSEPKEPQRWGWRERTVGSEAHTEWQPQGHRIGWFDEGNLYLDPDVAYAEVQRLANEQGESLAVTELTLRRRLKEKGLLASTESDRGKLTVRKMLQGERRHVLHVVWGADSLLSPTGPIGPTGPSEPSDSTALTNGPTAWAGSVGRSGSEWAGEAKESAQQVAPEDTPSHPSTPNSEDMGRLGQSGAGRETVSDGNNSPSRADGWEEWQ